VQREPFLDVGRECFVRRERIKDTVGHLAEHDASKQAVVPSAGMPGWGGRIRTPIWRFRNRMLLPVREELQNPISLNSISISKHSNFENRTEFAESRAPERTEPFGEE
jgi:hypothetical protein